MRRVPNLEKVPGPAPGEGFVASESKVSDYDYSNFFSGSGDDPFDILDHFAAWYDEAGAADAFVERLIENGPWDTEPVPLVAGGPEILPELSN